MVKSKVVVLLAFPLFLISCQDLNSSRPPIYREQTTKSKAAEFFNKMGLAAMAELNYSKAIANFKRATEIEPYDPEYWNNLGKAYMAAKFYKEAEKAFFQALKLKHDYGEAMLNLGILYTQLGNYPKAVYWLKKAANLDTYEDRYKAFYNLAQVYKKERKERLYVLYLRTAVNLFPRYREALMELINYFKRKGDIDNAILYYKQYLIYYPKDFNALLDYAELLINKENFEEAKKVLKFVIENAKSEQITQRAYKLVNKILIKEAERKIKN